MITSKVFEQSTASGHYPLASSGGRGHGRLRLRALMFLAAVFSSLLLLAPSAAYAADAPFTVTHPVTVTVRDATGAGLPGAGLPGTGDDFLPVAIGFTALLVGLAFIGYALYARSKARSQTKRRAHARAHTRTQAKAHQLVGLSLLAAALVFGGLLMTNPPIAQAAPGGGTLITVEKGRGTTARFTVTVDATATESRYLDIVTALEDRFPGVTFTADGDSFDHAGDTAVKHVSDPQNQSGGMHTITLTAQVSKDLEVGSYTHNVEFTVIDKRMPLTISGVTPQDRVYNGTKDVTVSGTPTLIGLATGDQVSLSVGSYTVEDPNVGTDKPVSVHGTLSGPDLFKYLLDGTLPPDPVVTITPAPLTFTGDLSVTKAYDGTPDIDPASIQVTNPTSFSGLVGSEGFTLDTTGITAASFADAAAGTNKPVSYTGAFSLTDPKDGALASNYTLTPPAFSGTIEAPPAPREGIELEPVITTPGQTVTVNKYFDNAFTVDWGDGSTIEDVTGSISHTYTATGTYTITLISDLTGNPYAVWASPSYAYQPLVPTAGTTADSIRVSYMPPMAKFLTDATTAPANFFSWFAFSSPITSLPAGSFNTGNITTVGENFFNTFACETSRLTSLPDGSFNTSNITAAGDGFFTSFSESGALTSLPLGSFDLSKITAAGNDFFLSFNYSGALTSLPSGSFDTSNITAVGNGAFGNFNNQGALTSLPDGSFDISGITQPKNDFFGWFNSGGSLASLPLGSFDFSKITAAGNGFFTAFNDMGALVSLPDGSFNTSNITAVGDSFFGNFNSEGALTSLPLGSFATGNITTVGENFFAAFNDRTKLTALPAGSFNTSSITTVGNGFFHHFNYASPLTSLPLGSFATSGITTAGNGFFESFNYNGSLASLPAGSFDTSNITAAGDGFFRHFNRGAALASLPDGSFDTSNVATAGAGFFAYFNHGGVISSLPSSFKWPQFDEATASQTDNFQSAFYSTTAFNRSTQDIINGCATPNTPRETFSSNQPGYYMLPANWQG